MKNKIFYMFLASVLALSLCSCSESDEPSSSEEISVTEETSTTEKIPATTEEKTVPVTTEKKSLLLLLRHNLKLHIFQDRMYNLTAKAVLTM